MKCVADRVHPYCCHKEDCHARLVLAMFSAVFLTVVAIGGVCAQDVAAQEKNMEKTSNTQPAFSVVRGRVLSEGKPLTGVMVSDGCRIARTDSEGEYTLRVGRDAGRFVFVTCPRGHWTDRFFRSREQAVSRGRTDFALEPVEQPDRFDFVFACDLASLGDPREQVGREKTKASIREICGLSPKPAFLWIQGDLGIVKDGGQRFTQCLKTSTLPVRLGIGNHEVMSQRPRPKELYESLFGPTYYSFDWGPVHFIVLDGNRPYLGRGSSRGVVEGAELAWLKADLAAQPEDKLIIVGVHIPIVSSYPARRPDLKEDDAPFWISATTAEMTALFSRYRVRLVLAGHMHENERTMVDGVEYVSSVSLCGRWWQGGPGLERATDGCPRGYRIVSVDGNTIRHRYQSSCESRVNRQGEFMNLPDKLAPGKATTFVFNDYDAPHGATARFRLDNGPWQAMTPVVLPQNGVIIPHHWRIEIDTTSLSQGSHTVEAEVAWPDGTVIRESRDFLLGESP